MLQIVARILPFAKSLPTIAKKIPWKEIVEKGPAVVMAAQAAYHTIIDIIKNRKSKIAKKDNILEIIAKVESLEDREAVNAKLNSDMANQIKILGDSLQIVDARFKMVLFISVVALIFSIGIIIWLFIG